MALKKIKKKILTPFANALNDGIVTLASLPGRYLDRVEAGMKAESAARKARDEKMIRENFGSVERYNQLQKDEAERLRKKNSKKKTQSADYSTEYARRMGGTSTRY